MSNQCTSWTGSHKYQARYDEKEIPNVIKTFVDARYTGLTRDYYILNIYVCDICIHCGDTIDRIDTKENNNGKQQ